MEAEIAVILEKVSTPLILVSSIDEVLMCNAAARKIFDVTDSMIGQPISSFIPAFSCCRATERGVVQQLEGRSIVGQVLHLVLYTNEISLNSAQSLYLLSIGISSCYYKEDMGELALAVGHMARKLQIDSQEVGMVRQLSHDLRTPLTSILGALTLLADLEEGSHSPEADRLIYIALENSKRMKAIIDSMVL